MWARVLGYAAGVLGAACLWLLLGSAPAVADDAPAPADRGAVGELAGALSGTARTTVDTTVRPLRDVAPTPVKRVVDATADTATTTVDRVTTTVERVADQPVHDTVEALADHTEPLADPAPEPAPHQAQPPTQQVEHQLPARAAERVEHRSRTDHRGATAVPVTSSIGPTAGLATAPSTSGSGSPGAAPASTTPAVLLDTLSPSGTSSPSSGGGPAAADAVEGVVLTAPEGVVLLAPARSRAVVPPASSPGFSPD